MKMANLFHSFPVSPLCSQAFTWESGPFSLIHEAKNRLRSQFVTADHQPKPFPEQKQQKKKNPEMISLKVFLIFEGGFPVQWLYLLRFCCWNPAWWKCPSCTLNPVRLQPLRSWSLCPEKCTTWIRHFAACGWCIWGWKYPTSNSKYH